MVMTQGRVILASRGLRPGILLNILQCTGQSLTQRIIPSKMSVVPTVKNSALPGHERRVTTKLFKNAGIPSLKCFLSALLRAMFSGPSHGT